MRYTTALLAIGLASASHAQLSTEEIGKRLQPIPAFICTNASGSPVTATPKTGKPLAGVFLDASAADNFLKKIKSSSPNIGNVKVTVVSMAEIYAAQNKADTPIQFTLVPSDAAVQEAQAALKANGKPAEFEGVPIFLAQVPGKGILNTTQNGVTNIPVFFRKAEANKLLQAYNKSRPKNSPAATLEVIQLEDTLTRLKTNNERELKQTVFVPDGNAVAAARKRLPGSK